MGVLRLLPGIEQMKALNWTLLLASLSLRSLVVSAQQPEDAPLPPESQAARATNDAPVSAAPLVSLASVITSPAALKAELKGERGLRLNFRGVPLEMVLDYLSEAAGFIFVMETDVQGKVDVYSQQPISKDEAVNLLNSILNKNGYAAIRNGRTLTIVSRDEAKKRNIPVRIGNNPDQIQKTDEMVTQIIPIRNANATQMTKDLQPLLPTFAHLTANESGNTLVLTGIQSDIRRMVEIVHAIDASISGITSIRVFPLRFADAKDLVAELKELFPTQSGSSGQGGNNRDAQAMTARFGGGGGPGSAGGMGGGAAGGGTGQSEAKQAAARVNAVADERTNSLVVTAPEDVMEVIERLVKEIDTSAENITRIKTFHLKNANPTELVDTLTMLFPDDTKSASNTRSTFQFGGGGGAAQTTATSSRAKQQNRVLAVADARTSRLIVTASSELMPYIEELVAEVDADPAKKQRVYLFNLAHANVEDVQGVLQEVFQSQSSRNSSPSSSAANPLQQRQQNQGYGSSSTSGFGNTSSSSSGRRVGQ